MINREALPMSVSQTLEYASIDELNLDPSNPRLGRSIVQRHLKQPELLKVMGAWKLDELALSFLENGQFWTQEAVICVKEMLDGKERLVVVEGNRRLAALRYLRDALAKRPADNHWADMVKGRKVPDSLFKRVPYLLADNRDSVRSFLGFRHVTGIEEWRPAEKAEFIAQMVDSGMDYDAVRRKIGSRSDVVRQNYIAYRMLLQIQDLKTIPADNFDDRFSVMYLSLRTSGVRTYLQIDITAPPGKARRPVPKRHLDALQNFALWLFGDEEHEPLFTDSRQVDRFGKVLESKQAVEYLEHSDTPNFEAAFRISGGDESEILDLVENASVNLEIALGRAHHYKKSAKLKKAARLLGANTKRLLEIFPGLIDELCGE
jgi:hypothetical protein